MIYLDTSVALAQLLAEDRVPPAELWEEELVSSRLMQYELWNRLHAFGEAGRTGDAARTLTGRVHWIEMRTKVLERLLHPFPAPVRTLDAIHLASALFLTTREAEVAIATYDDRMARVGEAMGIPLFDLAGK